MAVLGALGSILSTLLLLFSFLAGGPALVVLLSAGMLGGSPAQRLPAGP